MANGDITHVKELGRFTIPGGGRTLGGVAKNNKIIVWGEISGTWEDSNGLNLNNEGGRTALGLDTLDYIAFEVKTSGGTNNADEACFTAHLGRDSEEIYVLNDGSTNPSAADTVVLAYFAIGDANNAPDLG
jgi:hypothetical protein